MLNLYWSVYKNIEREVVELSNQIHFVDNQLSIYSVKISELLIRCSVEIEAISKELYFRLGGQQPANGQDLYFDTDCLQLLEDTWLLSKKIVMVSASNMYFEKGENRLLTPLAKANKRSTSAAKWKQAYQAVKHDRTQSLKDGNIKNLLHALAALFMLNIYLKDEVHDLKKSHSTDSFPLNLGSDIFSIKIHNWDGYDGQYNYHKKEDFDECIYFVRYSNDSLEKNKEARVEMGIKKWEAFKQHPKFSSYVAENNLEDYKGSNIMWDVLGETDYWNIIRESGQESLRVANNSDWEAVLNKNNA
ncbi:hypothetical protein [Sphingobacterium luzhongxinii]|uniref:hypothetical protein n=1 Tax=Sphingobacterium luzhongxinii TaxID=2654181 RepID=UPI0013D97F8C|nr:hypothetical protein [Sphingobacterium sp. xlx-73]